MMVNSTENSAEKPIAQEEVITSTAKSNVDPVANQAASDSQEDPNWRAFREARKKDRSEREAAEKRAREKEEEVAALKAAMEAAFAKSPPVQQQRHEYNDTYSNNIEDSEDEKIEKKVQAVIARREAATAQQKAEREHAEYPNKLIQTYPDFNSVIAQENLDYLDFHYPEVARPLNRLKDGFDKWSDVYIAIKKFVPNNTTSKRESARADINMAKPRSISSTGLTQNTETGGSSRLSDQQKASNWQRMQKLLKGVS